jgi:tetraacyldisaccharide 4'-kinase
MFSKLKTILKRQIERFEQFTLDVIYERRHSWGVKIYSGLLVVLSWLFSLLVQLRLFLYKKKILRKQYLGCLVVVVGNLTVGGTGKTPVVEKFARTLTARGRKVAILSRGYKSKNEPMLKKCWRLLSHQEAPPPKIVSDGKTIFLDSEFGGDEPYMLAKNLPGVQVIVDKNRIKAGAFAIKKYGVDTLILDDGLQYLSLKEQLNLLLIDKENPFGNEYLLPRGFLREPIKHLKRASYIFLTKSNGMPNPNLEKLIRTYNPNVEIIECEHSHKYLQEVSGTKRLDLSFLRGKRIAVFSGIAVPESFEASLQRFGSKIVYNQRFVDHHRYTKEEILHLCRKAQQAGLDMIVTTEKDAVRLGKNFQTDVPIYYMRLEIEILGEDKDFNEVVSRVCFSPRSHRVHNINKK